MSPTRAPRGRLLRPLDVDLVNRPRTTADLRAGGVTERELAGPLWRHVSRGVHLWAAGELPAAAPALTAYERIAWVREVLPPDAPLSGWAALYLRGVTDLDGRTGAGGRTEVPVLACVGTSGRIRRRPGLALDRSKLPDDDVTEVGGVLSTTPARACIDIVRRYGLEEGVVAVDAACRFGVLSVDEFRARVAAVGRMRASPVIRRAAELASDRSASCPESRLRVVWTANAGLPAPLVNAPVCGAGGLLLGVADLLDTEAALVGEYDGGDHRDLQRHTADNNREEGFERHNLVVVRATALDLWPRRQQLVSRLRAAHRDGMARDRGRDRWWTPGS